MKKAVVFILAVTSMLASAEPSKAVAYLMNEPVTLFDKGLSDLHDTISKSIRQDQFPEIIGDFNAWAQYDWDSNRITINGTAYQDRATRRSMDPAKLCARIVNRIKRNLGYSDLTDQLREMGAAGLALKFRHLGYSSKNEPETLESDLASITRLKISVYSSGNNKPPFSMDTECISDLTKHEVYKSQK